MIPLTEDRKMLGYELLASYLGISCFVTTRHGGCSQGNYASLNCTPYTGDEAEAVRRNQEIVCSSLPQRPQELVIPFQTHGTKALVIDGTYLHATAEERHSMLQGIDALITREPGCCICISTADCIPILLYDRKNAVIAAVHAGWRGTVNYILGHTLDKISTYGLPTDCNYWTSEYLPHKWRQPIYVLLPNMKSFSRHAGWVSNPEGYCRESC